MHVRPINGGSDFPNRIYIFVWTSKYNSKWLCERRVFHIQRKNFRFQKYPDTHVDQAYMSVSQLILNALVLDMITFKIQHCCHCRNKHLLESNEKKKTSRNFSNLALILNVKS